MIQQLLRGAFRCKNAFEWPINAERQYHLNLCWTRTTLVPDPYKWTTVDDWWWDLIGFDMISKFWYRSKSGLICSIIKKLIRPASSRALFHLINRPLRMPFCGIVKVSRRPVIWYCMISPFKDALRAWFLGNIKLYQMRGWLVFRVGPWFKATLSNSKTRAKAFAPACHLKFLIPYQITPDLIADQIYLMISNYCHKQRLLLLCTIGFQHSQ